MQRGKNPHFGAIEVIGGRPSFEHGCPNESCVSAERAFGDAVEARDVPCDNVNSVVYPPQNARPGAFGDVAVVEQNRLTAIELAAKRTECEKVRTFCPRVGSRVVARCGEGHLGERFRGGSKMETEERAIAVIDRFEAGKPATGARKKCEGVTRKFLGIQLGSDSAQRPPKTLEVVVEGNDRSVDREKRIRNAHPPRVRVAPIFLGESARRPPEHTRIAHRVKAMAGEYARHVVGGKFDPALLFREIVAGHDGGFWLDDSLGSTISYLGVGKPIPTTDGFSELASEVPFPVSRVGWASYGERERTLGVAVGLSRDPRVAVLDVTHAIEIDHRDNEVSVIAREDDAEFRALIAMVTALEGVVVEPRRDPPPREAIWRDSPARYSGFIDACLTHIRDGDAYQLCLTTRVDVSGEIDPIDTYLALRDVAPTRYGAYLRASGVVLLSASPESFLTVRGDRASTSPIKGTRPRSTDPAEDFVLRRELQESDKERAENLMIVDLCRNDLSKVCADGTVAVSALHEIETYSTVHQLVSTVTGQLAEGNSAADAARALFPAGSMTGAPKLRAVEILGRLETGERGIYAGVFGYGGAGDLTLAMTIRTIVVDDEGAHIGVGGGITADSIPDAEITEVGVKAAALLRVLGASPNPYLYTE